MFDPLESRCGGNILKKKGRPAEREGVRHCGLFKCKRRKWIHICCTDCREETCEERCINAPEKCRQVKWG